MVVRTVGILMDRKSLLAPSQDNVARFPRPAICGLPGIAAHCIWPRAFDGPQTETSMRTDITAIIHDAMEAHVPDISDENGRQEALAYLRGLKAILATRSSATVASVPPTSPQTRLRVEQVISKCRQAAIADALEIHRHALANSSNQGALRPEG
jgi:hypothetical protein